MTKAYAFPPSVRRFGLLGLLGLAVFLSSITVLHLTNSDIDWVRDYVSNLANERLGWVFMAGAFVHGWGNLALTMGLRGALRRGRLRTWGLLLFGLSAVGIMLAALFSIDSSDEIPTMAGRIHRSAAGIAFVLELAALFVFSVAFGRHRRWQRQQAISTRLAACAGVALLVFGTAMQLDVAAGLAERVALAVFLAWEIWVGMQLIRPAQRRWPACEARS